MKRNLFILLSVIPCLIQGATSLVTVHPSFDLAIARPSSFGERIGGMDFLSDGRLVVSSWEQPGSVYILSGVTGSLATQVERDAIQVTEFASGLHEPLGLKVYNDRIFVMQKQQLTELIDHNADGKADEYIDWVANWPVTIGFHEFGFGLLEKDGDFYASLSIAVSAFGSTPAGQVTHRGSVIKMNILNGTYEALVGGLRTPVGMGWGPDGELFVTDVQGDWLPANKLVHVQTGKHYGNHITPAGLYDALPESPPAVHIHQPLMGHSPGQPLMLKTGDYKNQLILPDVTYGGLQRIFLEKVKGEWQGAIFEFAGGLEAGGQRMAINALGQIFVGGIGGAGNWSWQNKQVGLNRLSPNGNKAFEMQAMVARTDGMVLIFTEPLDDPSLLLTNYTCTTWTYTPGPIYGSGNNIDKKELAITNVRTSLDKKSVYLSITGMQVGYSIYIHTPPTLKSATGNTQWISRGMYSLNQIPDNAVDWPVLKLGDKKRKKINLRVEKFDQDYRLFLSQSVSSLSVFDIFGRERLSFNTQQNEVTLVGLTQGIYFVKATINNNTIRRRIVLQ